MPFKMECAESVWRQYWAASPEVREAFFRVYQKLSRDPTDGHPYLMIGVPGSPNIRRIEFEHGTIVFRYKYDAQDAAPHVKVLA